MKICTTLGILVTLLAIAGAAQAGTAATGPLQGNTFICNVENVGNSVIQNLTIDILNSSNGDVIQTETCAAVEPDHECVASVSLGVDAARAFCRVTSTAAASQIRGNLVVELGSTVLVLDMR